MLESKVLLVALPVEGQELSHKKLPVRLIAVAQQEGLHGQAAPQPKWTSWVEQFRKHLFHEQLFAVHVAHDALNELLPE